MPKESFDIVFRGESLNGQNPSVVRSQVGRLLKASETQLEQLFSGYPFTLKKAVDKETAEKFRLAFRKAGALVEIRACTTPSASSVIAQNDSSWGLAPPNTGSLEEYAVLTTTPSLPNIEGLTLATPGVKLDNTPPPVAVSIDTSGLNLIPGQAWSLEDCQPKIRPSPLLNILSLNLSAPGTTLDETLPPPPANIDISAISVVLEQNWSLKDCQPPPPPEPTLDLSGLRLEGP